MIAPFEIPEPGLRIPECWKVSWDQLSKGWTIYPELRFESLLCLTLAPDFVLDFGWSLRDEAVRFTLQINRGQFGLSDVVVFESWFASEPALSTLQLWLDRLSADESVQANDHDLQQRLAVIEAKLRPYFIPPAGEVIEEPLARYLRKLIKKESAAYWMSGSSDAAVQYRSRYGVVQSQLIFMLREPHGVHMEFHGPDAPVMILLGRDASKYKTIYTKLGGAPWDLPGNQFVSRTMAARVLTAYIEDNTGNIPSIGRWTS